MIGMTGEEGSEWHMVGVFQVVFQGEVGANNLGDIAIDDISVVQGACPSKYTTLLLPVMLYYINNVYYRKHWHWINQ